jgi:alkylation response protein AidB-like acyl-CoA dehydrogenase
MDLELEDEQLELLEAATGTLDRHAPLSLARAFLDGSPDVGELWEQLAELGWLGVGLDEDDPFGVPGLCLLANQVGRHAAPTTLVDTACVARIAQAAESPWLERLVAGRPAVALALLEPGSGWLEPPAASAVDGDGDTVVVTGVKTGVHHAGVVGMLAVSVHVESCGAPAIALVDSSAEGVRITRLGGIDPSCSPCAVSLDGVRISGRDLLDGPVVEAELGHALNVAAVASTAEGLGAAAAALEMAVAYALEREQYGRRIGAFQALQHLMAEQHALQETAWASVLYASAALEERTADAPAAAAVAKAHGAAATKSVVEGALQVFGGVGFTREHDLHLLYRRALECASRFGGAAEHERRLADQLLAGEQAVAAG